MQSLIMAVGECLVHIRKAFFDSYRPERHYMRGPGPKCKERLGLAKLGHLAHDHG